MHNIQACF